MQRKSGIRWSPPGWEVLGLLGLGLRARLRGPTLFDLSVIDPVDEGAIPSEEELVLPERELLALDNAGRHAPDQVLEFPARRLESERSGDQGQDLLEGHADVLRRQAEDRHAHLRGRDHLGLLEVWRLD